MRDGRVVRLRVDLGVEEEPPRSRALAGTNRKVANGIDAKTNTGL